VIVVRVVRLSIGALLIVAAVAAGYWAGSTVMTQTTLPTEPAEPLTVAAELGELGRTIMLAGEAHREIDYEQFAEIEGTVTSKAGSEFVSDGDVILFVNLEPVVVAEGDIPGFRDLRAGDTGEDVAQLQEFLVRKGHAGLTPDGRFGASTTGAVKEWQESIGATPTGIVQSGAIHWLSTLPTQLDMSSLAVGDKVTRETVLYRILSGTPVFWLPLGEDQRNLLPESPTLQVVLSGNRIPAILGKGVSGDRGLTYELVGMDGGGLCTHPCPEVPLQETTPVDVEVVVVPETTGPVVPVAAIVTDPTGNHFVRTTDGSEMPVDILAVDGGLAVVSGVEPGTEVVIPGGEES
jgi:peptidoglycan hydrolase-like protein with peptidoglycan-binding domain